MEPRNRFQGINSASQCSLAGRYDNPIPTRFLAPIDCLKIPAQGTGSHCVGARGVFVVTSIFFTTKTVESTVALIIQTKRTLAGRITVIIIIILQRMVCGLSQSGTK